MYAFLFCLLLNFQDLVLIKLCLSEKSICVLEVSSSILLGFYGNLFFSIEPIVVLRVLNMPIAWPFYTVLAIF